ncbi:hypothetical protein [Nannocystis punicea]|uniref:Uncharacterized protein n=1 Tax=Nannocystis punicea TaxID=2995304 RepID=A0ABY7H301_9BACT|nr:hypothetical protein [Nannocystis poenicansa]WAS93512.1 hypothetical protein O0S08_45855 [Nannocystis poenicansa]
MFGISSIDGSKYVHCRGLFAAAMSLALLGCPSGGGAGTEGAPSSGDETNETGGTNGTANPATDSSSDPGGTDSTAPGESLTGDPTEGDPTEGDPTEGDPTEGTMTDTSPDEPPVEECHLADDNVECDLLVDRSGQIAVSQEHLYPPAGPLKAADEPSLAEPCDIYAQDCPEGQKCTALGASWSSAGCVPLSQFPAKVGEYCGPEGEGDTCEAGSICQFEPLISSMICQPLCGCSEANPTCGENERCVVYNAGVLPMCERLCNPFDLASCKEGEVCVKSGWFADFYCEMDVSGESGVFRDQCKAANDCDPGYSCEAADYVPGGCPEGVASCCTPLCKLDTPLCPEGSKCLEYFGGFGLEAPQCLENLGYCTADTAPLTRPEEMRWSI